MHRWVNAAELGRGILDRVHIRGNKGMLSYVHWRGSGATALARGDAKLGFFLDMKRAHEIYFGVTLQALLIK
jgi:hypothetical protein